MGKTVIAIIGASVAGTRAAETLRAKGFDGHIKMIGAEPYEPYERPALSKNVLVNGASYESLRLRRSWTDIDVDLIADDAVIDVDPLDRRVEMKSGAHFSADMILLATGGRGVKLSIPGSDLPGVYGLRDLNEAMILRDALMVAPRVVIIGGGFVGLEVAASAHSLGCDVTVIEAASVPLSRGLGPSWGAFVAAEHIRRGVKVGTGVGVRAILGRQRAEAVELDDGTVLPADVVVVGVGMQPRSELARRMGLRIQAAGVVADGAGQTANPAIFAAGDVTIQPSWGVGRLIRYESYQNAEQQATAAATRMLGMAPPPRAVPWFWSDQFDMNLQIAGELSGTDEVVVRGDVKSLSFIAFHLKDQWISGVFSINRGRDVRAATSLIANRTTLRLDDLADESFDLKRAAIESAQVAH